MSRFQTILLCVLLPVITAAPAVALPAGPAVAADAWEIEMSDRLADLRLVDGQVQVQTPQGPILVEAEVFLRAIEQRQHAAGEGRSPLYRFLDITTPAGIAWVAMGFLGQLLFTGRMILQWLVSEKHRRSIVPAAFWWMSLGGASMLLLYFIWRQDIVGVLGQGAGWMIYARNLWLIGERKSD